jgi:AraC-like DNA-binding protein
MERATRLLRETTLAVKEVAWACGFAAPSYFIRSFRAHHGVTPKAWRDGVEPSASADSRLSRQPA